MAVAVIEINDSGVGVSRGAGLLIESPGCAVLGEREVLVGEEAQRRARLYPRRATDLFWSRLDQTPLDNPVPQARSFADVAYLHLREVAQRAGLDSGGEVVFAVPGTFEREQIALLLGIARACSLQVLGIVDSAVAAAACAAAAAPLPDRVLHLDLQLHQGAITALRADGAALLREEVVQVGGSGFSRALDALVRLAGDLFVRETRFDPLHGAEAEQSLTDDLRRQLAALGQSPGISVSASAGRRLHRVTLPRELVIERLRPELSALAQRARELAGGGDSLLLLSHRLARLPGALSAFELGAASRPLSADAAAVGALAALPQVAIAGQGAQSLPFVTRLAVDASPPAAPPRSASPAPTHLLLNGVAHAIGADSGAALQLRLLQGALHIGAAADSGTALAELWRTPQGARVRGCAPGISLNGAPLAGERALCPGDRLAAAGGEALCIAVRG